MKKVLVTGGLGYIGSHTVVELHNAGIEVVIADDLSNTRIAVLDGIEKITGVRPPLYRIDIGDREEVKKLLSEHKDIDGVIHFAAFKAVGESVEFPLKYYRNNVGGMVSLLEELAAAGVQNFVFSSSCTVYGDTKDSPISEDHPVVKPNSPYGNTKKICEEILSDVSAASELRVVSLRYFNPVGAHETAEIGELPLGVPNNLVPYITQTAAGIRDKLTIFGQDYDTADGTCIRDYIHVVDLAEAHVKAIEYLSGSSASYEVFNVGTGKGSSVLDVVHTFEKVNGIKLNYAMGPRRPGDVEQIWASTDRANKVLGWKATRDLDEMMSSAWKWQQALGKSG